MAWSLLIVDDHADFRAGARALLEVDGFEVLGEADPWGLGLLDLDDEQAAHAIGAGDPALESGTCTYEVVPMELVRPG